MKNLFHVDTAAGVIPLLSDYGFATLPTRDAEISESRLRSMMDTFIQMTMMLSPTERKAWEIDADGDGDPDDGLIERNGGVYDHKFFFHFKSMWRITDNMVGKAVYTEYYHKWFLFLCALRDLHEKLSLDMYDIAVELDKEFPKSGILSKVHQQDKGSRGVLRLLYYKPGHTEVAKPHYDQSMLTFHVADSHPGLLLGKESHKTKDIYIPKRGSVLVFPGSKTEIATDGAIESVLHSAIGNESSMKEGRWSIVFFYHCNVGLSSKEISAYNEKKMASLI